MRLPSMPIPHRGVTSWQILAAAASLVVLAVLSASLVSRSKGPSSPASSEEPLIVYCAASNKSVIEAIRGDYEQEFGTSVQVQYGASQTLLAALDVAGAGDLFLPADDSYLKLARDRNLISDEFPLAQMQAVVAVPKGNPKNIQTLADLLRSDVRLAQANPDAAAIGKLTREALTASGQWDPLHAHTTVYKTNVNEVANDVKVGAVDCGIVFDVVLHEYPTLEAVNISEFARATARVGVAIASSSKQRSRALQLARYLSAKDKGLVRYREFGFQLLETGSSSANSSQQREKGQAQP